MNRLGRVLTGSSDAGLGTGAAAAVRSALDGYLPTGFELILFKDEARTVLVALHRFNEDGTRCLQFKGGHVTLPIGEQHEVIRRAASMMGMERVLLAAPTLLARRSSSFRRATLPVRMKLPGQRNIARLCGSCSMTTPT